MAEQQTFLGEVESPLVSAVRLAQILKVTDQTVYNWRDAGMAAAGMIRRGGQDLYNVEKCRAWVKANRHDDVKGGARPGAGRKKKKGNVAAREFVREAGNAIAGFADSSGGQPQSGGTFNIESVADLMEQGDRGGINASQGRAIKEVYTAAKLKAELEKELGSLVPAEDVETTWAEHILVVKMQFESIPLKGVQALRGILKLDKAMGDKVQAILQAEVDRVLLALATSPLETELKDNMEEAG